MLTLPELREANLKRVGLFRDKQGRLCHENGGIHSWNLAEWSNAMAGECGETCNLTKKIIRGDYTIDEAKTELAYEIADVIIYADLLAAAAGIDLETAIRKKFNAVSLRVGCDIFI